MVATMYPLAQSYIVCLSPVLLMYMAEKRIRRPLTPYWPAIRSQTWNWVGTGLGPGCDPRPCIDAIVGC